VSALIDLTKQRFGRLTVLSRRDNDSRGRARWLCKCDCGNEKVILAHSLRRGTSRSCGCLMLEIVTAVGAVTTTHGHAREGRRTPTYRSWKCMRTRCCNPNHKGYSRYGGRGIKVCDRWSSFENFLADMGEKPAGLTIDRFPDNNGNYEPGNVRWATPPQQARGKRSNVWIEFRGQRRVMKDWATTLGLPYHVLQQRLRKAGWSVNRALSTPVGSRKSRPQRRVA
jgi:hypothetical protein